MEVGSKTPTRYSIDYIDTKLVRKNANTSYLCRCHGHRRPTQNVPIPFESARAYIISFSQNKVFQKRCVSSFGFMRSHDVPAVVTVEGWRAQRATFVYACFLCSPCGIPAMPSSCLSSIICVIWLQQRRLSSFGLCVFRLHCCNHASRRTAIYELVKSSLGPFS